MPKQVWKIERFDGGLNTGADPRDIDVNELAAAVDIAVDDIGKITSMGSFVAHDAGANKADITAGYGLHYFSHDRINAHYSGNHLDEPDLATHVEWDDTGVADSTGGNIDFTFAGGTLAGTTQQVYGDRLIAGTNGAEYSFTYTVSVTLAPNYFTLTLGNFPASGVTMPFTAGTHTVTFTSHASASTRHFTITGADDVGGSTTRGRFAIDNVLLQRIGTADDAETGDDYLVMADADAAANLDIYSSTNDVWGVEAIDLGSTTGMKPVFYNADGALRVSDGNFGAANQNKWFGYIKQTHFLADVDGDAIEPDGAADAYDGWYTKSLDLAKPTRGLYGEHVSFTDSGSGNATKIYSSTAYAFQRYDNIGSDYIAVSTSGDEHARLISAADNASSSYLTTSNNDGTNGWQSEDVDLYPSAGTGFNIYIKASSTTGNWPQGGYEVGTTFLYEGNQESEVFEIHRDGNRPAVGGQVIGVGFAIDIKVFATSPYDPFIIGGRAYIRLRGSDNPWILLADISLRDGARTDLTSAYSAWALQESDDSEHNTAPDNAYCNVTTLDAVTDPSPWTYEAINGYRPDESVDIGAGGEGFKTAVVANRQVYVGNVKREHLDGITRTEGDAMYKSMPGKFDTFPIARKIEASVQDGDEIVKLEEYADRILQFKKRKMHLINISQDIEFLEDTFLHKGILVPGAACKTDFGIAWANENGCYLYDGKGVRNLLEKKGVQVIKESTWRSFLGAAPMVGYAPKERQIIVGKTAGSEGLGDIFLFDMVSQSWVKGDSKFTDSKKQTNLVVDWDHDLVHAHSNDVGTVIKWDTSPVTTTAISFKTKDIDFGQPSVRKKVYKVYISFKGGATTTNNSVTIQYSLNGDTDTLNNFYRTSSVDSKGLAASDKTNSDSTPLSGTNSGNVGIDDWVLAELRPATSVKNCYSFQIHISGTIAADFEINDISIVYRVKNIK